MDTEETLTPEKSLDVIMEAIAKTKENFQEDSFCFLLWGWLIAIASLIFFFLQQWTDISYYFISFPIAAIIGMVATLLYFRKEMKGKTLTYTAHFFLKMWTVLGLSFIIVVFINVSQGQVPFTYTLIIAGIGTLISGWMMRFKALIFGGFLLLTAAIISIYIPDGYVSLLHGIAFIAGYLIPGYLLKNAKV